jgi:hypothetical protein
VLVMSLGLLQEVVVLVVGLEHLQVVSLLGILPLVLNTGMGGSFDRRDALECANPTLEQMARH